MNVESDFPVEAQDGRGQNLASESLENQGLREPEIEESRGGVAYLHPPIRKTGVPYTGRYQVEFDGDLIVEDSRDPETDLARALLSRGMTGMVKVLDANTKKHRTTINIEKAAKLRTVEGPHGPRFVAYQETRLDRPRQSGVWP